MINNILKDSMKKCLLCSTEITTSNDSREHIIPNSIGGVRKTRGFICGDCNSKAGQTWDAELAKQLNKLALFFRVVRDRGENKREIIETTAGEKYIYGKDKIEFFEPTIEEKPIENGIQLNVVANNMAQAHKILKGLKRKHPQLNIEAMISQAESQKTYPEGKFIFSLGSLGGPLMGRSLVKTALAVMHDQGLNPGICGKALDYLLSDGKPCFGYYYAYKDVIKNRVKGMPLHCVGVIGNPWTRTIQAYIEYFGFFRVILGLSDNYRGKSFKCFYAINPTTGSEVDIDFDFSFSQGKLRRIYNYKLTYPDVMKAVLNSVVRHEEQRQIDEYLDRLLKEASIKVEECFSSQEYTGTEEDNRRLVAAYLEDVLPFIAHIRRDKFFK